MTYCREIENELPLYFDGVLDPRQQESVERHLSKCPLCRQKLSELREVREGLRRLPRATVPSALVESLRAGVSARLSAVPGAPNFVLLDAPRNWLKVWLMPSVAGGFATVTLAFALLS